MLGADFYFVDNGDDAARRAAELGVKPRVEKIGVNDRGETVFRLSITPDDAGKLEQVKSEYEARKAQFEEKLARARSNTDQMFADQGRVLWNSGVNIVEGLINQALDAAGSKGGQNPLYYMNPYRPHVDLSSAKMDYRSEMMRRNLEGKLDGEGIKAGEAIEMGVTIFGPLVVGRVSTPKTSPQSLKTLGGIPEVQPAAAATVVTQTVTNTGVNPAASAVVNRPTWRATPSRTVPSSKRPLEARGTAEKVPTNITSARVAEQSRSIRRQNEAAELLSEKGYFVEYQPRIETFTERMRYPWLNPKKRPDFRIEGEIFDGYSPGRDKTLRGIVSEIRGKTEEGQARRILLNLDDSNFSPADVAKELWTNKVEFLDEVLAVKGGKIFNVYPF